MSTGVVAAFVFNATVGVPPSSVALVEEVGGFLDEAGPLPLLATICA